MRIGKNSVLALVTTVPVMTFQTAAAPETVGFGNHVYNHLTRTSYGICENDPCGPSWFIPVAFI